MSWCVQEEEEHTDGSTASSPSNTTSFWGRDVLGSGATSDGSGNEGTGGGGGMPGQDGHPTGHPGGSSDCVQPEHMLSYEEFLALHAPDPMVEWGRRKLTEQEGFAFRQDWAAYLSRCKEKRDHEAALLATAAQLAALRLPASGAAVLPGGAATFAPPNSAPNRSSLPPAMAPLRCTHAAEAPRKHLSLVSEPRALSLQRAGAAARTGDGVRRVRPPVSPRQPDGGGGNAYRGQAP